jgi:hypothetical protein
VSAYDVRARALVVAFRWPTLPADQCLAEIRVDK